MFGVSVRIFVRVYPIQSDSDCEHLMQSVWLTCWHRETKESNGNLGGAADVFISWWISRSKQFLIDTSKIDTSVEQVTIDRNKRITATKWEVRKDKQPNNGRSTKSASSRVAYVFLYSRINSDTKLKSVKSSRTTSFDCKRSYEYYGVHWYHTFFTFMWSPSCALCCCFFYSFAHRHRAFRLHSLRLLLHSFDLKLSSLDTQTCTQSWHTFASSLTSNQQR